MKRFVMKNIPIKPVIKTNITECFSIEDGTTLIEIVNWANNWNISFENVYCDIDYYSDNKVFFILTRNESDEEYKIRLDKYEKDLIKYDKWKKENEDLILERERQTKIKENKKKQKELQKLQQLIKKKEKELQQLKSKNNS